MPGRASSDHGTRTASQCVIQLVGALIVEINGAMIAAARRDIDALSTTLERIEASAVLAVEGKNAEERKAQLTLALADDARYGGVLAGLHIARDRLADADRRVTVAKERCRLCRAALTTIDV